MKTDKNGNRDSVIEKCTLWDPKHLYCKMGLEFHSAVPQIIP